jgi:hypothetical protein
MKAYFFPLSISSKHFFLQPFPLYSHLDYSRLTYHIKLFSFWHTKMVVIILLSCTLSNLVILKYMITSILSDFRFSICKLNLFFGERAHVSVEGLQKKILHLLQILSQLNCFFSQINIKFLIIIMFLLESKAYDIN